MLNKIKNEIDKELKLFLKKANKLYNLKKTSTILFESIREFVLRKGKRVRPLLFILGYLGFTKKPSRNLYTSAISFELMHDFLLIHDDIIDKSDTRRGKPSLHKKLNNYLKDYKNIKFNGQDLSIVIADIIYALSIAAFLSIKENEQRKEEALKKFIEATIYTGGGELTELLNGLKPLNKITEDDVYKVYDYKTAYYTFASPLACGAILAGATQKKVNKLSQGGLYLGRAFQIKDDILGIFSDEKVTGKSSLSDLQEAKKTLLIWYAYQHSDKKDKSYLKKVLQKKKVTKKDLLKTRELIITCGALDYAQKEISSLINKAKTQIATSRMKTNYKKCLIDYLEKILGGLVKVKT